jgi:hypothetical protein
LIKGRNTFCMLLAPFKKNLLVFLLQGLHSFNTVNIISSVIDRVWVSGR